MDRGTSTMGKNEADEARESPRSNHFKSLPSAEARPYFLAVCNCRGFETPLFGFKPGLAAVAR